MSSETELKDYLTENRDRIGEHWLRKILETYPSDSSQFLKKKKDQFENPLGHAASLMVDGVLDHLRERAGAGDLKTAMFPLIQARAVQGFQPSAAVDVVYMFKRTVLELSGKELLETGEGCELLLRLDAVVDELAKLAFDIYCECRDRLNEVRTEEIKRNLFMLLKEKGTLNIEGMERGS